MGRSTVVVIWLALAALALRPIERLDSAARLLFEPARQLARIALPFRSGASAAASSEAEARERVRALLLAEQEDARPADGALVAGRGLVHAQVIDRSQEQADLVIVRYPLEASIESGMPVVCGDVYVGSVVAVGHPPLRPPSGLPAHGPGALGYGEARVRLVTAESARVGARAGTVELVVGGLARVERSRSRPRLLSVRALQGEPGTERELRVHEDPAAGGTWSALAEGYRLGSFATRAVGTRTSWAIEPLLDYRGGFSQVFVLCPPERAPAGALLAQDPFDPQVWLPVRAALDGGVSAWRETRRLLSGTRAGLVEGAAVARGPEFVGRIARADFLSCDVECLGDPGFRLLVLASVAEQHAPLHLGRVTSLGSDPVYGRVYLSFEETPELARALAGRSLAAQLYSSSGERGIPPGLHLGSAEIPAGEGAHVLALQRGSTGGFGTALEAWVGERAEAQSP